MAGISRVSIDSAGGTIIGILAPTVFVDSSNIVVQGASVAPHGVGEHAGPVMAGKSSTVFANGIGVCRSGDAATCGHPASGSSDVFAGG